MQGIQIRPVRLVLGGPGHPAWRPAMSQNVTAATVTPPSGVTAAPPLPVPEPVAFVDSALVSTAFDILGATASGILAYGASLKKNKLSYLFGGMAAIFLFKFAADVSNVRTR